MKEYEIEINGIRRTLPFVDIDENLAYASFVVISDTELISKVAPLLAEQIGNCDMIVTAEAKGIALAYEISRQLGLKRFIVARKSVKSYMKDALETKVRSITTTSEQHLYLDKIESDLIRDRDICILDDVVSTGESLAALETLAEKAGARVIKKACILAEGKAADRDDLIYLQKLPLFRKTENKEYEVIE